MLDLTPPPRPDPATDVTPPPMPGGEYRCRTLVRIPEATDYCIRSIGTIGHAITS